MGENTTLPAISEDARVIEIHIPLPPSANKMWRAVNGGIRKSKEYRIWKEAAVWQAKAQLPPRGQQEYHFSGPIAVCITVQKLRANADLDNRIKPTIDLLETLLIVENDCQVHDLRARWADVEGAVVRVEELKDADC